MSEGNAEPPHLNKVTIRARIEPPTAGTPPSRNWRQLRGGDVYYLPLGDHSDLDFTAGHSGMKYMVVARHVEPDETQVPVFMTGTFDPITRPHQLTLAARDDFVLLMPVGDGGPAFCRDATILVDCSKAPTLHRRRFEKKPRRQDRRKQPLPHEIFEALRDAHLVGMHLESAAARTLVEQ